MPHIIDFFFLFFLFCFFEYLEEQFKEVIILNGKYSNLSAIFFGLKFFYQKKIFLSKTLK